MAKACIWKRVKIIVRGGGGNYPPPNNNLGLALTKIYNLANFSL